MSIAATLASQNYPLIPETLVNFIYFEARAVIPFRLKVSSKGPYETAMKCIMQTITPFVCQIF